MAGPRWDVWPVNLRRRNTSVIDRWVGGGRRLIAEHVSAMLYRRIVTGTSGLWQCMRRGWGSVLCMGQGLQRGTCSGARHHGRLCPSEGTRDLAKILTQMLKSISVERNAFVVLARVKEAGMCGVVGR